ncbi:MAG: phosphoribosylformylglycinamidine synthase subunit PurQ [Candidatus Sumerlaeia bacterium]|nr:phosphoribosylformylglycinamidine synthase subunit PurQ [Candidatus Sumerlaeia bacterium]
MKAACVTFPGSNCDQDMHRAIRLMGWELVPLWHTNSLDEQVDIIFIPGGFSYGDYLRCGALARFSPAMASIRDHASRGGLVMGICNGFQILCEAGFLPGALVRNKGLHFHCTWSHLRAENTTSPFTGSVSRERVLRIPIAHGEGNYTIDGDGLKRLEDGNQITFRYCAEDGRITDEANPNGSVSNIAGIINDRGNILGMMPHPERAMEAILGGEDGRSIFESLAASAPVST